MTEPGTPRVAVYLDFDNIVISRYDQVHGRNAFQKDKAAGFHKQPGRLTEATVGSAFERFGPRLDGGPSGML